MPTRKRPQQGSLRYSVEARLTAGGDCLVELARDTLTQTSVVLKTGALELVAHEATCLLSLPEELGPRLLDLFPVTKKRWTLVLERIEGVPLAEAAGAWPVEQIPRLARALLQCLGHLHRSGWIHADLSPGNVLVFGDRLDPRVRLVDFGLAIDIFGASGDEPRGGTLPFIAPELAQGRIVDGRTDLYSAGMVLRELFPSLVHEETWAGILSSLSAPRIAGRYANALAARQAVEQAFGLPPGDARWPRFGGGGLVGRSGQLRQVVTVLKSRSPSCVLVQARAGTGLTRFLLEAALASARAGRPVHLIDLPRCGDDPDRARQYFDACIEECHASGIALLCGIDDASPGLHTLSTAADSPLRERLSAESWNRVLLPPLPTSDQDEILMAALGPRTPGGDLLIRTLVERAEGDLRLLRDGLRSCLESCAIEEGTQTQLPVEAVTAWSERWQPAPPGPEWKNLAAHQAAALRSCAWAGMELPKSVVEALLNRFHPDTPLLDLLSHGYLIESEPNRVAFCTRGFWRGATPPSDAVRPDLDRWLFEHWTPDSHRVEEVLAAARRARRVGDAQAEGAILSQGLDAAANGRQMRAIQALVAYPSDPPPVWTREVLERQAESLGTMPGSTWSPSRVLGLAALSVRSANRALTLEILEHVARDEDPHAAVPALAYLLDDHNVRENHDGFAQLFPRLRAWDEVPGSPLAGVADFLLARNLQLLGKSKEALEAARRASRRLRGSGLYWEALTHQLLAIVQLTDQPRAALRSMRQAVQATSDPELRSQARFNLSLMYARMGRLAESVTCAAEGLREVSGRARPESVLDLRLRLLWNRAVLDRIEEAKEDALALLRLPSVRNALSKHRTVTAVVGHCLLQEGQVVQAVQTYLRRWQESTSQLLRVSALRYVIDALMDVEDWETVKGYATELTADGGSDDSDAVVTLARARALVATANGDPAGAWEHLHPALPVARSLSARLEASSFFYHCADVLLQAASGHERRERSLEAAALIDECLKDLPAGAYGYWRVRAMTRQAEALRLAGQGKASSRRLDEAIALARRVRCRRWLARGLEMRMAWESEDA